MAGAVAALEGWRPKGVGVRRTSAAKSSAVVDLEGGSGSFSSLVAKSATAGGVASTPHTSPLHLTNLRMLAMEASVTPKRSHSRAISDLDLDLDLDLT